MHKFSPFVYSHTKQADVLYFKFQSPLSFTFGLHHWATLMRGKNTQVQTVKLTLCSGFRHPQALPSTILPAQIAVTVGGWVGAAGWLPHLRNQSSKQNVPTAMPKISIREIMCCDGTAVGVLRSRRNRELDDFLRWSLEGSTGYQRQSEVIVLNMASRLYKEPTVNYSSKQLYAHPLTDSAGWKYF